MSAVLGVEFMLWLAVLFLFAVFFVWWFYKEARNNRQQSAKWELEQQKRDKARIEAIEEGLREWMKMLGLPQLEEEKKLRAAARQLRIVLVEKLVHGPRVR